MRTTAIDDGDSWVLNGTKRWITNGNLAQVALVWAKVGGAGRRGPRLPRPDRHEGLRGAPIHKKMSLRASVTSELILEDVRIPKDAILPNVKGMKGPLSCLTQARFGIAWGVIGAAMACFDSALDYAKNRVQFAGKPIAAHQLVQAKFADMLTQITKAQLMALEARAPQGGEEAAPAARQHDQAEQRARWRSRSRARCRDILGGNGITLEYPVMRHLCNLETVFTYEGTHDIHTLILGQDVTGHRRVRVSAASRRRSSSSAPHWRSASHMRDARGVREVQRAHRAEVGMPTTRSVYRARSSSGRPTLSLPKTSASPGANSASR